MKMAEVADEGPVVSKRRETMTCSLNGKSKAHTCLQTTNVNESTLLLVVSCNCGRYSAACLELSSEHSNGS